MRQDDFDFSDISLQECAQERRDSSVRAIETRAKKTRARIHMRRARSEAVLNEVLPPVIAPGDAWHVISSGDVDSMSFLSHLLKHSKMRHVLLSTWCMAMPDVVALRDYLISQRIGTLDVYVGEIFPAQYAEEYETLCEAIRPTNGRVAVFRNHSKIIACAAEQNAYVIESSANVNTNPRTEQTTITADASLYRFYREYFDAVRSFARDFDAWTPSRV